MDPASRRTRRGPASNQLMSQRQRRSQRRHPNYRRLPVLEGSLIFVAVLFFLLQSSFLSRMEVGTSSLGREQTAGLSPEIQHRYENPKLHKKANTTNWTSQITKTIPANNGIKHNSPYAYSFIIGGIHETNVAYKGFIYNVLIATRILRRLGSQADFICHLQLSSESKLKIPPPRDLELFSKMNITTILLPKDSSSTASSFTALMYAKFEILKLTQYRRILYLDSDILPLSNLDYLLKLSDPLDETLPTILQPNVMQASSGEPANGGMFIVEPSAGRFQQLLDVMERQEQHYKDRLQQQRMGHDKSNENDEESSSVVRPFDKHWGWGHDFHEVGDEWHAVHKNGSMWTFHGAHADQGLLFHFFKYELGEVSAIVGSRIEEWTKQPVDGLRVARVQEKLLLPYAPAPLIVHFQCQDHIQNSDYKCVPPYRDFFHFVGRSKPWQNPFEEKWFQKPKVKNLKGRSKLWFLELRALNEELGLGLDILNWNHQYLPSLKESPLGYIPLHSKEGPGSSSTIDSMDLKEESSTSMNDDSPIDETIDDDDDKVSSRHQEPHHHLKISPAAPLPPRNSTSPSLYAYAFIVGSVHEGKIGYKGFLYNVMVSAQLLQRFGSQADIVVFLQLSPNSTLTELPREDVRCLTTMGIHIIALPKPQFESFADLMFDKFRILQLTQYRRVMYLDADVMPLTNLDYLFQLSDPEDASLPTPLLPNMMQASGGEPANGGMFMARPYEGAWEQVLKVIARQRKEGKHLKYPNFHRGRGWGYRFGKNKDNWHAAKHNGSNWVFHGAHADQGLLYFFFRFVLQNTSHVVGRRVENWMANSSNPEAPYIGQAFDNLLMPYSERQPPILSKKQCKFNSETKELPKLFSCFPPYRDVFHFMGKTKPWQNKLKAGWLKKDDSLLPEDDSEQQKYSQIQSSKVWFSELQVLNLNLDLGLNLTEWNVRYLPEMQVSPLGYDPLYVDNSRRIFEETP